MVALLNIPGVMATIKNGIQNTVQFIKQTFMEIKKDIALTIYRIHTATFEGMKWVFLGVLVTLITIILKKPLEFITRLFCAILISIGFIVYAITTIPPFHWLAFAVWFFFKYMVKLILYTIINLIIFVIVSLVFMILAILNFMTKGSLNKMALCQTSPLAWHQIPSYHTRNFYERSLFCKRPCALGFAPDKLTGNVCDRIPLAQPNFCPQASVMRVLNHDASMTELGTYTDFILTPKHMSKTPQDKEQAYVDFFTERQKFFDTCDNAMKHYTTFADSICASLDAIKGNNINGLSDIEINKLIKICKQGFCNSKKTYSFCAILNNNADKITLDGLIKSIVMLILHVTIFAVLILSTYKMVSTMQFAHF
jgi:hypothetical protein